MKKTDTRRSLEQLAQENGISPADLAAMVQAEHNRARREWYRTHRAEVDAHRDATAVNRLRQRGYAVIAPNARPSLPLSWDDLSEPLRHLIETAYPEDKLDILAAFSIYQAVQREVEAP